MPSYKTSCLPEEFNDKILSPELNDSELRRLHGEVSHIYETYCLDESIDKISFGPFIVEEIRNSKRASTSAAKSSESSVAVSVTCCRLPRQSPKVRTRMWCSCRRCPACSRRTNTSCLCWRESSRPCSVTATK